MAFRLDPSTARDILRLCHAFIDTDFFTLGSEDTDILMEAARRHGYRKPKNANGSKGRQFFAYVQKAARQPERNIPHMPSRPTHFDHKYEPGAYGVCRRCGNEKH